MLPELQETEGSNGKFTGSNPIVSGWDGPQASTVVVMVLISAFAVLFQMMNIKTAISLAISRRGIFNRLMLLLVSFALITAVSRLWYNVEYFSKGDPTLLPGSFIITRAYFVHYFTVIIMTSLYLCAIIWR